MDINGGDKNRVFLHDLIKITEGTVSEGTIFMHIVKMAPSKGKKKETEEVEAELGPKVREGAERSAIQDDNHTQVIK